MELGFEPSPSGSRVPTTWSSARPSFHHTEGTVLLTFMDTLAMPSDLEADQPRPNQKEHQFD